MLQALEPGAWSWEHWDWAFISISTLNSEPCREQTRQKILWIDCLNPNCQYITVSEWIPNKMRVCIMSSGSKSTGRNKQEHHFILIMRTARHIPQYLLSLQISPYSFSFAIMPIDTPYLLNSTAINLLCSGQFNEAIAELKGALWSIKQALDSREPTPDQHLANFTVESAEYLLIPKFAHRAGYENDQHIVPLFNKVFTMGENFDDGNLLAAVLLYNMAVAYSLEQHECTESTHIIKLYRFSLQILHDSGLMWNPSINLLLMALYNNIAHVAFCDHLIQCAEDSLRELALILMDDSLRNGRTGEELDFFESNSLVWANEIILCTSPAA